MRINFGYDKGGLQAAPNLVREVIAADVEVWYYAVTRRSVPGVALKGALIYGLHSRSRERTAQTLRDWVANNDLRISDFKIVPVHLMRLAGTVAS